MNRTFKRNPVSQEQRTRACELRQNSTLAERKLWSGLRNYASEYKFRRQYPIGPFIADFYSPDLALVIEVDGDTHCTEEAIQYDAERSRYLVRQGLRVKRYNNLDVINNLHGVLTDLKTYIDSLLSQS
jgi:very-short-patch-repair endonuclease